MNGQDAYEDWYNSRTNSRDAIADVERTGVEASRSEAEYYRVKAIVYAELIEKHPATAAAALVKGDTRVNEAMAKMLSDRAIHHAAKLAAQLFINEEAHTYDQLKRAESYERN